MPLAIELAAAGAHSLSLAQIERQIRASLGALVTTLRDIPPRHRSLRAVFEHSWSLLSEEERVLFSHVAVFRGGWTMAAAEQVAGATLGVLTALVDKSLVRSSSVAMEGFTTDAVPNAPEPRFTLLEPIREYALEQLLARGEAEMVQHAHASYYLALAEAAAAQWDSPTAEAALAQLDREYDNLRAVLLWACDGGDRTLGLQLGVALRRYWQRRGYYGEGCAWLEELLVADDTADPAATATRLGGLETAAWLASDQHDYVRASQLFEQSTALRRSLGERESETQRLSNAARQAGAAGQYAQATALLEDRLAYFRACADRGSWSSGGLGMTLYELGLSLREQGSFAR
jgi:tetratricopeptide (TPR) repeat protein